MLVFICVLFVWNDKYLKFYLLNLLVLELFLLLVFSTLDLMIFYMCFEGVLIPMYLIVGVWGSRERRVRAAYLLFFYTLVSSILLFVVFLDIFGRYGTLQLEQLADLQVDSLWESEVVTWVLMSFSFGTKIPMFPTHIWLPEAHVEAPTVGSVLLAGILLKLGVYGFIRVSITLFPFISLFLSPIIYLFSLLGILYASIIAVRQSDLKRIIAYSSIAHMNLVLLGLFCFNNVAVHGAIVQSISHGFVSGGMFFIIGMLYDRYHSRLLYYYGGLAHLMPIFSIFFLIFTLSNIALPGTSSFVGEFLLLSGILKMNIVTAIVSSLGVILCGIYSFLLYNRICFGNLKINYTLKYLDITIKEFAVLMPLICFIFLIGLYSSYFSELLHLYCTSLSFIVY